MYSFDVFDTSLVRTVASPDQLLALAAVAVLQRRGVEPITEYVVELARVRREAERSARDSSEAEDVSLAEIYGRMDLSPWGIGAEEMMEEELRIEVEWARPIAEIRERVSRLREEGERVVFVSDTPLPSKHLEAVLEKTGFAPDQGSIYTSGDVGLTKASGRLFDHVRHIERPGEWVHIGDHPSSDVAIPRRRGIETHRFDRAGLSRRETVLATEGGGRPWERSLVAGVSRSVRLSGLESSEGEESRVLREIVLGVAAPLLTCFVAWVLREAVKSNTERLYFVSRDGDLLLHIVSELAHTMPVPECRYLYGSRQAWSYPAITKVDRSELGWLLDESPRLGDLLSRLRLDPVQIRETLRAHGFSSSDLGRRLTERELESFWEVLEEPEVTSRVLADASRAREAALAYLVDEDLTAPGRWALVDVGWKLRSQQALKKLLATVGHGEAVRGYYLAMARQRASMRDTGPFRTMAMPETDERVDTLLNHAMVIEEAFLSADHGSVVGYGWRNGSSTPEFADTMQDPRRKAYLSELREVTSEFVREAAAVGLCDRYLDQFCDGALASARSFLSEPTPAEAAALAWMIATDQSSHDPTTGRRLAVPLGPRDAVRRLAMENLGRFETVQRYRQKPARYFWEEGSRAISPTWIRLLLALASLVRLRTIVSGPARLVGRALRTSSS